MSGWWQRNRWGLALLPLALVVLLGASAQHFRIYYWDSGLHDGQHGHQGDWVTFLDRYDDAKGHHLGRVQVRLESVRPTTGGWADSGPLPIPRTAQTLAIRLSLRADPRLPLRTCSLALIGSDGTRYDFQSPVGDAYLPTSPCVPPDHEGPWPDEGQLLAGLPPGAPRPGSWTVTPVVVVPRGVSITAVDVWWQLPSYLSITTSEPLPQRTQLQPTQP